MKSPYKFNRRNMLRSLIAMPALNMFPNAGSQRGFLYAGSANFIHVMRVDGEALEQRQIMESNRPAALAIHPNGRYLYAANDVEEHGGLPRGTVEVFAISARTGILTRIGKQALSLSATCPRSIAISPDSRYVIAAAYGGGIYNLLPLDGDGRLGDASAIRKEIGSGPHPARQCSAHPHSVIFDSSGRHAISSDLGCDWVSVWRVQRNSFLRVSRIHLPPGAGPGTLTLHANDKFLDIAHDLAGTASTHSYNAETGEIGPAIRHMPFEVLQAPLSEAFLPS